jgi:hypothetical protein
MKRDESLSLEEVLVPKSPRPIETIVPSSRALDHGATTDGFSFATLTVGGESRHLRRWVRLTAWIFLGCAALGLLAQAVMIFLSLLQS